MQAEGELRKKSLICHISNQPRYLPSMSNEDSDSEVSHLSESLSYRAAYGSSTMQTKGVGIICVILSVSVISTAICLYTLTGNTVPFDYGIVVDAGSSHTQFYVYRWLADKSSGTGDVSQKDTCTYKKGIADLPDPTIVVECGKKVAKSVPTADQAVSPLYLGATAGMRLLNLTSPEQANLRLLILKYSLKQIGVDVKDVGIISGRDEGLYSWITVNFLTKSLSATMMNTTYGALDLGGASTQFAYAVDQTSQQANGTTHLKLYGNDYYVFSKSFLCFGADQIFLRHQALLINDFNSSDIINDPCLPKGNLTTSTSLTLFNSPCTSNPEFKHWLEMSDYKNKTFTFQGTSDFNLCKAKVNNLLNETFCQTKQFMKCPEKVDISSGGKFMAFSSFSYVTSFLNATNVTLNEMLSITKEWCDLSWEEINYHQYNPDIWPHLTRYCFGALYILSLLTTIYGFDETSWKNLIFQDEIANSDIGWTLGYMINATNAIPEEDGSAPAISLTVLIILLVGGVALFVCGTVFLTAYFKNKKRLTAYSEL